MSGLATPDLCVVDKATGALHAHQPGDQATMTVLAETGTTQVTTAHCLRTQRPLTLAQVARVTRVVLALEAAMGWPVDVEGAWRRDTLHVLQCRPITTLTR